MYTAQAPLQEHSLKDIKHSFLCMNRKKTRHFEETKKPTNGHEGSYREVKHSTSLKTKDTLTCRPDIIVSKSVSEKRKLEKMCYASKNKIIRPTYSLTFSLTSFLFF